MAKLCPFNFFVDATGEPLNGGLIYTYQTGASTTPKTTYTDSSGQIPHTNPVRLNTNGRKEIWLDTDSAYRFLICDRDGVQIGATIDDVIPVTSLAAGAGGEDLDMTGYSIITTGASHLYLTPELGRVVIDGLTWPSTDGSSGNVLATNGAGTLSFSNYGVATIDDIPGVTLTAAADDDLLKFNGSAWVDSPESTLSYTASQISNLADGIVDFSNKTGAISQWTNDSSYTTNATVASATLTFTNKSGNVSQWTNDSSFATLASISGSQAEVEAASDANKGATCANAQYHPGMAKAWFNGTKGASEWTINSSYNVASVVRMTSPTRTRVTFTTPFANANYTVVVPQSDESFTNSTGAMSTKTTTYADILFTDTNDLVWNAMFYGDQ